MKSFWSSSKALPALFLIGAVSYFLLMEHRQHLLQWLPFVILGLCPLMHIFMHRGHAGQGHDDHSRQEPDDSENAAYQQGLSDGKRQSDHQHNHGEG